MKGPEAESSTMEVVEEVAEDNEEVDVRFEIGDWRLEMGENDQDDPNEGEMTSALFDFLLTSWKFYNSVLF